MTPSITRHETRRLFSHVRYIGNPGPANSKRNNELRETIRQHLLFTIQEEHLQLPHVGNTVKIVCVIEAVHDEEAAE